MPASQINATLALLGMNHGTAFIDQSLSLRMIESSKVRLNLHFALAVAAGISVQPGFEHYSDVLVVRQKTKTVGLVLDSRRLHKYHDNGYLYVYCNSEGALHCRAISGATLAGRFKFGVAVLGWSNVLVLMYNARIHVAGEGRAVKYDKPSPAAGHML